MRDISLTADELVTALLRLSASGMTCLLDSCGVGHLGSHLLIAGIDPVAVEEIENAPLEQTLRSFENAVGGGEAAFFTLSYGLGERLLQIPTPAQRAAAFSEPDIYIARFDVVVIHDHDNGRTWLAGDEGRFDTIAEMLSGASQDTFAREDTSARSSVTSNFTRDEYIDAVERIQELIRDGVTYQTNLTQQLTIELAEQISPEDIFWRMRRDHPAPFAAFIRRPSSTVVSASPERFFHLDLESGMITTSPIKGTRPRGTTPERDDALRSELLNSEKDRAENTMIVDLLRNDIGRICQFGSVTVEKLCDLEEHPTLFHLVSTISGRLLPETSPAEILAAVFPCGSITGAPKISTMRVIAELEGAHRGLSMGAIGYYLPDDGFGLPGTLDLSVAIRTMTIRGRTAVMNVGGGIVIDSDPATEYDESLTKSLALLNAAGGKLR